tara:strand:- start:95 stop:859 length:765 start_codon:yes stop_codon:yes gene_type:complete
MAEEKNSPLKILPVLGMAVSAAGSIYGAVQADKQQKAAAAKEAESRKEMDRLRNVYANLDTSNPFMNMENTMEDLTIDQKQAEFQSQQFQQSQANILEGLRGSAGGSGVAALAQQLAQSGQLAAQQSSASIGQQESRNQMAERQMASELQAKERQGELISRQQEKDKQSTLLGMAQQETAAYADEAAAAQAAKMGAISGGIQNLAGGIAGFGDVGAQNVGNLAIQGGTGEQGNTTPQAPPGYKYDAATNSFVPQ